MVREKGGLVYGIPCEGELFFCTETLPTCSERNVASCSQSVCMLTEMGGRVLSLSILLSKVQ